MPNNPVSRCGLCRFYRPSRNPDTGRVTRSKPGHCEYPVVLPKSAGRYAYVAKMDVWPDNDEPCRAFEAANKPKSQIKTLAMMEAHG